MDSQGKEEHKLMAPRVCLHTTAAKGCCGLWEKAFGKPGYAVYESEVSESVKSYFRQAVIFRKKALHEEGRPFLPLQVRSL